MAVKGEAPDLFGVGEYGATTVAVSKDGSTVRIAFGRNGSNGIKMYTGAVLLSKEAVDELKEQLTALET